MTGHDKDNPVAAHVRITVRTEAELTRLQAMVAEIVRFERSSPDELPRAIHALVTSDQLAALEQAGLAFEHIAKVWSKDELKQQVSQENRYAQRLAKLRSSRRSD